MYIGMRQEKVQERLDAVPFGSTTGRLSSYYFVDRERPPWCKLLAPQGDASDGDGMRVTET